VATENFVTEGGANYVRKERGYRLDPEMTLLA
jgi:hypothetical protein